ncbi:MAG: hypothetical protein KKA79_00180, partial [Nanoarchaeota archaeon]|nr:hypothetical protein [Nanoarchaeota archaeon]
QTSGAKLTLLIDNNISQTLSISTVYSTYTALSFDFNLDVGVHELRIKAHNPIYTSSSKKYPIVDNIVVRPPNLGDKYYYTMFKASLQPDVEQTLRIQFSIDSEHDFSFIRDNRYLLPGFRVTMFENVSSDNLYIVDYTGKSIYSNVYKGTPVGPNGYQVDIMVPLDYAPLSQVEDRVFQITPMWLSVNGSEYPLVAPLNADHIKFASFTHLVGFGIPHILYIKPSVDFDSISIVVNENMNNITGSGTYVFGGYTIFVINGSWSDYYSDSVLQNEFKTVAGTGNDSSNTPVDAVLVLSKNSNDIIDIPYSVSDSWFNVWTDFSVAGLEALKLIPNIVFDARIYLGYSFLKVSGVERIDLGGVSGYGLFVRDRGYTVVGMKTAEYIDLTKTLPVLTKKTNMVQASCYEGGQCVEYLTITNEKVLTPEESRILAGNTEQMQAAVKWVKAGAAVMVIGVGVWQGWEVWTGDYDDTTKTIQLTLIAVETGIGVYYGICVGEKVAIKTGMVGGKVVGIPYASVASVVIGWVECGRHLQIAFTIDRSTYVGEMRYRSEVELAFGSAVDGGICALPYGIVAEFAWLGGMMLGNWLFKSDVPVVSLGTALIINLGNLLNIPTSEQMAEYRKLAYEDFKDYLSWRNCYMTSNPQIFVG